MLTTGFTNRELANLEFSPCLQVMCWHLCCDMHPSVHAVFLCHWSQDKTQIPHLTLLPYLTGNRPGSCKDPPTQGSLGKRRALGGSHSSFGECYQLRSQPFPDSFFQRFPISPAVKCDFLAQEDTAAFSQCGSCGSSPQHTLVWVGRDRKKKHDFFFFLQMIFS